MNGWFVYILYFKGDTPLIMATKKDMVEIVTLLLDRGADISCKNKVKK